MSERIAALFMQAGMSEVAAQEKALLFRAIEREVRPSEDEERWHWFIPGALPVLGSHATFAGGRVLLCAAEQGLCVAAGPRSDSFVRIRDVANGQTLILQLSPNQGLNSRAAASSLGQLLGRISRDFTPRFGVNVDFASDLPSDSGMGNAAALRTAIVVALAAANRIELAESLDDRKQRAIVAEYLSCVERNADYPARHAAVNASVVLASDYAAILLSASHHLKQCTLSPPATEADIPMPSRCAFVVAVPGIQSPPAVSDYVQREAIAIMELCRAATGTNARSIGEALNSSPQAIDQIRLTLRDHDGSDRRALADRFERFYLESEVVIPEAAEALRSSDLRRFGESAAQAQYSLTRSPEAPSPETAVLVEQARAVGAYAACAFGSSGSVWALVDRDQAATFSQQWRSSCMAQPDYGSALLRFLVTGAGPSIVVL